MRPYCETKNLPSRCTKVKSGDIKNGDLFYVRDSINGEFYYLNIALKSNDKKGWIHGRMLFSKCKFWDNYHVSSYETMHYEKLGDGTPYNEFYRLDSYGSYYQNGGAGHYWLYYDTNTIIFSDKMTKR